MKKTNIQWCDSTFSPWRGCTKVSEGCKNCYIYGTMPLRMAKQKSGSPRIRSSAALWNQVRRWDLAAAKSGATHRVFPSLCDWLDDEVPIEWLADFLKLIHETPHLDWQLLTKRPENYFSRVKSALAEIEDIELVNSWSDPDELLTVCPANVWIGVSCENQEMADKRIPQLLLIPAHTRFISAEPMLGPIDFSNPCYCGGKPFGAMPGISWVIFGGESGPNARPCNVGWILDGVEQCRTAGVAAFVKQLGANCRCRTANEPIYLEHPKGGDPAEWHQEWRVREFPAAKIFANKH